MCTCKDGRLVCATALPSAAAARKSWVDLWTFRNALPKFHRCSYCAACRYEIFRGSEFVKRTKSNSYTFGSGELPEGNTTLWVRAFDPEGADVRASIDVYVAPKSAEFDAKEQIFSMDVQQAVGSNDPSMLARTGSMLGTLTDMAKGKSQSSNKGRRLLETAEAAYSDITEIVRVKVMQLLAALTSSSASSVTDPATMRQVRRPQLIMVGTGTSASSAADAEPAQCAHVHSEQQ